MRDVINLKSGFVRLHAVCCVHRAQAMRFDHRMLCLSLSFVPSANVTHQAHSDVWCSMRVTCAILFFPIYFQQIIIFFSSQRMKIFYSSNKWYLFYFNGHITEILIISLHSHPTNEISFFFDLHFIHACGGFKSKWMGINLN